MNKPHDEQVLQQLYADSKRQCKAPAKIRQQALDHASRKASKWQILLQWQTLCAAVFVAVLALQIYQYKPTPVYSVTANYTQDDELIYYHRVELQQVKQTQVEREGADLQRDQEYFAYLSSLSKLQDSKHLAGVIKSSDTDVVVQICQLGLVQLSPQLMQNLTAPSQRNLFEVGAQVTLIADNKGQFVAIEPVQSGEQCAE